MTTEFEREERYIVFKLSDVERYLTYKDRAHLATMKSEIDAGRDCANKPPFKGLIVESDWPEYEPTWKAIKARVTGAQPAPSAQDDVMREHVMDAVAKALGDAYDCTRVWSAWGYGTMGSDDFRLVANDPDRLHEIAEAAIQAVFAAALKPEEAK